MKFTLKQLLVVFIATVLSLTLVGAIRNYLSDTSKDKDEELAFYKEAWDSDFESSKARQSFREKHPNTVYYAYETVYYCPMVVDCPLMPCNSSQTQIPVWYTENGSRFRQGYVIPSKSDSLFQDGKVIYWDNGGFSIIDTSNTWFTVY